MIFKSDVNPISLVDFGQENWKLQYVTMWGQYFNTHFTKLWQRIWTYESIRKPDVTFWNLVTESDGTSDFTVQYSKTQVHWVSITFGIMFFFNFGFDISFLFMKSFVKKENFRFLLIWRCHISRIWNFSYYYQYDASGRLSLSNPARFWWLIIRVFENVSFREIHSWSDY